MCLAIPGQILSITHLKPDHPDSTLYRMGTVRFGGITKQISLAYVPEATIGDYVVVHAGFAISTIDEQSATGYAQV